MISLKRQKYFQWLTSGVAATSLALIVFIPSLTVNTDWLKWLTVGMFIIAMLFSITANLILRELDLAENKGSDSTTYYIHISLLISIVSYFIGFSVLTFSIHFSLLLIFLLTHTLCKRIYKNALKTIKDDTNAEKSEDS